MDYKVQKSKIGAQLAIRGKRILRGFFFVVPPAYPVPDSDLLVRFLNESDDVIPFERAKKILLLNKYQISYVRLPMEKAGEDWAAALKKKVKALLPTGQELSGTVLIDLPEERQRVLDFMNMKAPFFVLRGRKEIYILNKTVIQGILPLDAK